MNCNDLTAFADGEMSDSDAAAFREHIAGCLACEDKLVQALQMSARLSDAPVTDAVQFAATRIADEGTFWSETPLRPCGFSEATTRVDTRRRHRGVSSGTVAAVSVMAFGVSVATSLVLLWSGVAGSIIGVAAQATGLSVGCVLFYRAGRKNR